MQTSVSHKVNLAATWAATVPACTSGYLQRGEQKVVDQAPYLYTLGAADPLLEKHRHWHVSRKSLRASCSRVLPPHQGSVLFAELTRSDLANMDIVKRFAEGGLLFLFRLLFLLRLLLLLIHAGSVHLGLGRQ